MLNIRVHLFTETIKSFIWYSVCIVHACMHASKKVSLFIQKKKKIKKIRRNDDHKNAKNDCFNIKADT